MIHALFMLIFGGRNIQIKISIKNFYVGCKGIFNKWQYLIISLSPSVILVTVSLCFFIDVAQELKWVWYLSAVFNFFGAFGDIYASFKVVMTQRDAVFQDSEFTIRALIPE
jgi:hypothetical protein